MDADHLDASTCPACGHISVPPEPIGCEGCGLPARDLELAKISAAGVVTAHALVHQHAQPEPTAPFVVVEVKLDAGPVVRALLRDGADVVVEIGSRVGGRVEDERFAFELTEKEHA